MGKNVNCCYWKAKRYGKVFGPNRNAVGKGGNYTSNNASAMQLGF